MGLSGREAGFNGGGLMATNALAEVSEESRALAHRTELALEAILAAKLGRKSAWGECQLRLKFSGGELTHVKVIDETDMK